MIPAIIVGALTGLALFGLIFALIPRRVGLARRVAAFDQGRPAALRPAGTPAIPARAPSASGSARPWPSSAPSRGWEFRSLRSNLNLVGKSFENFIATKVLLALFGLIFPPVVLAAISLAGVHLSILIPVWAGLVFALIFFFLPDLDLRQQVERAAAGLPARRSAPSSTWSR